EDLSIAASRRQCCPPSQVARAHGPAIVDTQVHEPSWLDHGVDSLENSTARHARASSQTVATSGSKHPAEHSKGDAFASQGQVEKASLEKASLNNVDVSDPLLGEPPLHDFDSLRGWLESEHTPICQR